MEHIRLQGDHNNNKLERFDGEVRDREKVMRGLKKSIHLRCQVIKSIITISDLMKD